MMRILAVILSLFLFAAPVLAQQNAQPAPQQQEDNDFTKSMARMMIAMMERMLTEMKKQMLGNEKTKCECHCKAVPEANT